jgi:hypothetical protein
MGWQLFTDRTNDSFNFFEENLLEIAATPPQNPFLGNI